MTLPRPNVARLAASLVVALLALASPSPAAPAPDLVVVAEPTQSDSLAGTATARPVTLAYRVLEIFSGETGSSSGSVIVRHDALSDEDRARLRDRERVILLARHDPEIPGRYIAPAPLRATPSAVAAFRKWSAPEDVRAARPLDEVMREIERAEPGAAPARARPAEPAAAGDEVRARGEAPVPPIEEAHPAETPQPRAAAPIEVGEEDLAPRREVPALAAKPEPEPEPEPESEPESEPARVASSASSARAPGPKPPAVSSRPATWEPPYVVAPSLHPPTGPGLPPAPPPDVLGPEVSARSDLRVPERGGRRR